MCISHKTARFPNFPEFEAYKVIALREDRWRTGPYSFKRLSKRWRKAEYLPQEGRCTKIHDEDGDYGWCVYRDKEEAQGAAQAACRFGYLRHRVVRVLCKGKVVIGRSGRFQDAAAYVEWIRFPDGPKEVT